MRPALIPSFSAVDAHVDQTGGVIDAAFIFQASVLGVSTGASTGTIKVQASNDAPGAVDSGGLPSISNWSDVSGLTTAVTAGSTFIIPKFDVSYRWLRLVYSKNNGSSGTLTAHVKTNGV